MSAGLATFDYDGDGLIDVYFPNGAPLQGTKVDRPPRHALYKNLGNFKFREVTDEAGVVSTRFGLGIAIGDYDNDGWPDLYLDNFGPNVLFRNNGDGSFTDASDRAGVRRGSEKAVGAEACFLDVDGDGHLDLYVGNYIDFSYEVHVPHVVDGLPSYPSPRDYAPVPDTLYRNNGDGTFSDSSVSSGIARRAGRSMGMVCADFDSDGHTDVFICNDVMENFLFHNDGTGKFEEVGLTVGTAFNCFGETMANMGADAGDYDNDGWIDLFVTNYQGQWPILFRNIGGGGDVFENVSVDRLITLTEGTGRRTP
jgi:hypothetical protein